MTYISASRLKTFSDCPRKAILSAALPHQASTKAQKRGTELHTALEQYLLGKTEVVEDDLGDLARKQGLLPDPSDPIFVEIGLGKANKDATRYEKTSHWTGLECEIKGLPVRGIVDLVVLAPNGVEIVDHKSCSDWFWAETEESLRTNIQLHLYAKLILEWLREKDLIQGTDVTLSHIQYNKKAKEVRRIDYKTSQMAVEKRWERIERLAEEYAESWYASKVGQVLCRKDHCGAYGGCPFLALCESIGQGEPRTETIHILNEVRLP